METNRVRYFEVTKKFRFSYAHVLPSHKGLCNNLHGHNATVEITLRNDWIQNHCQSEGMVYDFGDLKKVIDPIIEKLDHSYLNEMSEFEYVTPTAENICLYIENEIVKRNSMVASYLYRIRVWETEDSYAQIIL